MKNTASQTTPGLLLFSLLLVSATLPASAQPDKIEIKCPGRELPYPRQEPAYKGKVQKDFTPFAASLNTFAPKASAIERLVSGKTIPELQQLMTQGKLSSEELVLHYLNRIRLYDVDKLNSVLELNPDALLIARARDAERRAGKAKGLLQGIPVLLKDNIATGDKMHTTAGAAALRNWKPQRDAFLTAQLRRAGAILLGKANLSEWANYMDACMPSGFSANGGQTRNPYGPFDTWGSSSGSAVSVAAGFVTVSVGSETQGSIIMPAGINSVVALKTSMGLVSRDNILPLLSLQDVPGPMGKTVTDVAILLTAMTGYDARDKATKNARSLAGTDFSRFLNDAAKKKFRVAVPLFDSLELSKAIRELDGKTDDMSVAARKQLQILSDNTNSLLSTFRKAGITAVPIPYDKLPDYLQVDELLEYGFKSELNAFLKKLGTKAPQPDLAAIIAYNKLDMKNRAPYGQGFLEASQNTRISASRYDSLCRYNRERARLLIDSMLRHYNVDAILNPVAQLYAPAGYPALTIPGGYNEEGQPDPMVLVGTYLSEPALLAIGYALEQATGARRDPPLEATLKVIGEIIPPGKQQ